MRLLVLLNETAGSTASGAEGTLASRIRDGFAKEGVVADVRPVPPGELSRTASELPAGAFDAVLAAGGDGTASTIANAVRDRIPLGVLPLGTHNHFAKDLGVPLDLDEAIAALARGSVEPLDVAEVEGRLFLNFSAIGIHPRFVVARDARRETGQGKLAASALATAGALRRSPRMRVRLTAPGRPPLLRRTSSVIVCTNAHQMEVLGVTDVSYPDRGVLNVYVTRGAGPLGLVWLLLRALVRRLGEARRFESLVLPEVTLDAGPQRILVSLDGEVTDLRSPLRFRVRRKGLRVLRPAPAKGA